MRMRTVLAGALAVASVAGAAGAEDRQALEVLGAARKAIGGAALDSLRTFGVDATLQRNLNEVQLEAEVEILLAFPDKYVRAETSSGMMNMTMTTGFKGDKPIRPAGAVATPGGGMMIRLGPGGPIGPAGKLSPEEQERADRQMVTAARAEISRMMLGWFAMAHPALAVEYRYAGEAESPDGRAHAIDVKSADGFAARLFIDTQSNLPLMVAYRAPQPRMIVQRAPRGGGPGAPHGAAGGAADGRDVPADEPLADFALYFDEWRSVDGIRFPNRLRRSANGSTVEEWTITKVKVNPKIDPRTFDR